MAKKSDPQKQEGPGKAATQFKPGQSGNPGGKPAGARNRLQAKFLNALADDFEEHGVAAIETMRTEDPVAYVRAVASLMPKEIEVTNPLQEMSDDAIIAAISELRALVSSSNTGSGDAAQAGRKQAQAVPRLH